jgi:hypothetical protein
LIKYYEQARALLADGGKGEAVACPFFQTCAAPFVCKRSGECQMNNMKAQDAAPKAECAPLDKLTPSDDQIVDAWKAAGRLETVGDNHEQAVAMVRALQAECAPREAVCDTCHGSGHVCVGTSGSDSDGNAPELEPCPECAYGDAVPQAEWQFPHLKRCSDASNLPQRYEEDPRDPQRDDEAECAPHALVLANKELK